MVDGLVFFGVGLVAAIPQWMLAFGHRLFDGGPNSFGLFAQISPMPRRWGWFQLFEHHTKASGMAQAILNPLVMISANHHGHFPRRVNQGAHRPTARVTAQLAAPDGLPSSMLI